MKPPKSIRNIVHTLLGKKSKPNTKDLQGLDDDIQHRVGLDKNSRHHRSADDLAEESASVNSSHHSRSSVRRRSSSLPRRSQSCMSVRGHSQNLWEPIYGRRVVNGLEKDHTHQLGEPRRNQYDAESERPSSSLTRPYSRNSSSQFSRSNFSRTRSFNERDHVDRMSRTSSWSHSQSGNNRTDSANRNNSKQVFHPRQGDRSLPNPRRFPSEDDLLSNSTQHNRPNSVSMSQREITEEKLRTCLHVLDRLSAQVKEIKDVSKRVVYVDTKVKNGNMKHGELERRLRELDLAEAASQRLKNMLKSGVGDISSSRHSSLSSGYDSENSAGSRSGAFSQEEEIHRSSRPSSRMSHSQRSSRHLAGPTVAYQGSQPYPQSISDMMPIWDAKDLGSLSPKPTSRHMTREDSTSSGYATGSGSEDGRRESPNCNDVDSVASVYSMQGGNLGYPQRQDTIAHAQFPHHQHFSGYPAQGYDPYAVYGTYPQNYLTSGTEEVYGNYGELYGYATSSVYDNEIYSNGWYQLPSASHSTANSYNHTPVVPSGPLDQGWGQVSYIAQNASNKHGGLSDLFYDPTAQSDVTLMETIAKEVALDSQSSDDSTWKTYGSFRYRNGQRMVTSSTNRKRKTVRFSQTVRQRVETEESEMEDSTSVIKGGEDNDTSNNSSESQISDAGLYMMPRQQAGSIRSTVSVKEDSTSSQQNGLPEPIYEFPSGHIESSCMCSDCILARSSCQMQPTQALSYYQ